MKGLDYRVIQASKVLVFQRRSFHASASLSKALIQDVKSLAPRIAPYYIREY